MFHFSRKYYILAIIFIVNFLFKLIYISNPSLWYDEIISARDTLLDFGHIKHEAEWDKNPPMYHYVLWVWAKIFGISELALRSMSAFFSSLTAVLIYWFSSKITNKTNATISVVLYTFHPFLYYYAQEARCFSFLIFLVIVNLITLYSLINKPSLLKAFVLGVLNFLIFYTHYLAGLILFCQFLYLLIVFRTKWLYLVMVYLTPILLVLLRFTKKQYLVLFFSNEMSKEKSNVPLAKFENLIEALGKLFVSNFFFILFILFLTLFIVNNLKNKVKLSDKDFQFKLYVLLSPILCIATLYLLGTWTNVFHERYLLFQISYVFISIAVLGENKIILYLTCVFIFVCEMLNLKFNQSKVMDYKFAAILAKEIQKKEDAYILIQTHDVVDLFTYYYKQEIFLSKDRMSKEFLAKENIFFIENFEDLKNVAFPEKKPILLFQTYQKRDDERVIDHYFENQGYYRFSTDQIEGVRFSYLKNK